MSDKVRPTAPSDVSPLFPEPADEGTDCFPLPVAPELRSTQIRQLLESYFWPTNLEPNTRYVRLHDDHDGKFEGHLSIVIGEDGDAWVAADGPEPLRFRMPSTGGGRSPYTRTALVILAEAIRLDNEVNGSR
jgi:hypothetical protein